MTARTIRDWRGVKTSLSRCSNAELVIMLAHSLATTESIGRFAGAVQAELIARRQVTSVKKMQPNAWPV